MNDSADRRSEAAGRERSRQVGEVIDAALARRIAGHPLNPDELNAAHADLQPELAEELRRLTLIDGARRLTGDAAATLHWLRCPQCRESLEFSPDDRLTEIACRHCGARVHIADDPATAAPARLGRFRLISQLGSGSFGIVWRALDTQLDREVALKVPRLAVADSREGDDFLHEARAAAQLQHPSIVAIHEVGQIEGVTYIVSDLIEGEPLHDWANRRPPTFREAAELCRKIAVALDHAHEAGVVHRDLKPANLLIDERGEPHITDFGLAKRETGGIAVTAGGRILGTPAYMSPEQASGDANLCGGQSDLYSLGVVLYELLTDELPFRGNSAMVIQQLLRDQPLPPRRLNAYIPRDLETICLKCLEKRPPERYATGAELADDLGRFLAGEPTLARPVGRVGRGLRWCRRKPALAASGLVIALLLGCFVGALTWGYLGERAARQRSDRLLEFINLSRDAELHRQNVESAAAMLAAGPLANELVTADRNRHWPKLQAWAEGRYAASQADDSPRVYSWFVLDAQGTQVARGPRASTIGKNYAWRMYFHGLPHDLPPGRRPPAGTRITRTHHSADFATELEKKWVITVSTPITRNGDFIGAVGVMLPLSDEPE